MNLQSLLKEYDLERDVADISLNDLVLDSRKVKGGDAFFALRGTQADGVEFIEDAVKRGAQVVFKESENFHIDKHQNYSVIGLPKLDSYMPLLADRFYGEASKEINAIAVTGTNGKSTCVSLIAQAAKDLGCPSWQLGTLGYGEPGETLVETGLTTPDLLTCHKIFSEARNANRKLLAMEVSSHAVTQGRVRNIRFKAGVFTNITRDHLDYHGSFEDYCEAKLSLLRDYKMDFIVINIDDEFGEKIVREKLAGDVKILTYSIKNRRADIFGDLESVDLSGTQAVVSSPWGKFKLSCCLVGEFNLSNLLVVVSVMGELGYDLGRLASVIKNLKGVDGRLQKVKSENSDSLSIFVDYAHTPDALQKVLETLRNLTVGHLWVVFGCGGDRDMGKRAQMAQIASRIADHVVITSDNPRTEDPQKIIDDIRVGLTVEKSECYIDRALAINNAVANIPEGSCLLIAGKGHEKYQIVGDQYLPFDDCLVAEQAMKKRGEATRVLSR